jgi:uncharacterized protein (TIGR00730 family)
LGQSARTPHPQEAVMSQSGKSSDAREGVVPPPAHPLERREPLPSQEPKPSTDDPKAPALLERILESPSYRRADQDVYFLDREDSRGLRLQLDYLKPEVLLQEHGIANTIVVFGSTRICEPKAAQRHVEELATLLEGEPGNAALQERLAIAKRLRAKSRYYEIAREFAQLVGKSEGPHGKRTVVVTGGGPGIMEGVNRGAYDAGARSIGLNITLPTEQFPNPYITPDLCFRFHYFALRKLHFLKRARALVAFPGGFGTFDELFEALTLIQSRKIAPIPVVLVGEEYWQHAFDVDFLVQEGTIDPEDRELFWYAESAQQVWDGILDWYKMAGLPFLP